MNISQIFKRTFLAAQFLLIVLTLISSVVAQTSSVDPTFNSVVSKNTDQYGNRILPDFTVQPDGKTLIYGTFQVVNGVINTNMSRVNSD